MAKVRIILAYDKSTFSEADKDLLRTLVINSYGYIVAIKIGLEAMMAETVNGVTVAHLVRKFALEELCVSVMWDVKLLDISNTVLAAVRNILRMGVSMFTLHAQASDAALGGIGELCQNTGVDPLAVTVLTDLDSAQCRSRFYRTPLTQVLNFTRISGKAGIRGIVCSPRELRVLGSRGSLDNRVTVIPATRSSWMPAGDQKRTMTPAQAARAGANYIVMGRQLLNPPMQLCMTPEQAAQRTYEELDRVR